MASQICKNLRLARQQCSNIIGRMFFCSNRPLVKTTCTPHDQQVIKSQTSAPSETRSILGWPRAFHNVVVPAAAAAAAGTKDDDNGDQEPPEFVPESITCTTPDYLVEIDSFSNLFKYEIDVFEAGVFETNGYKWALRIYPEDLEDNGMPVSLALADPSALPENWTFEAFFSTYLKNQTDGSYHEVKEELAQLDAKKTECVCFVPNHILRDPKYGYLKNDTCVFGANIYVTTKEVVENVSLKNFKHPPHKHEFEIPKDDDNGDQEPPEFVPERKISTPPEYLVEIDSFSNLFKYEFDDMFEAGVFESNYGYKWALRIYPDVMVDNGTGLPVLFALADPISALPENWKFEAFFTLYLKNQTDGSYHVVEEELAELDAKNTEWICFVPIHILRDPKYGYLKNDTCVFGAEIFVLTKEVIEYVSLKNFKHPPHKQEFEIPNFPFSNSSSPDNNGGWVSHQTWNSQAFHVGGREWKLKVCPKGWEDSAGHLSIFLENYYVKSPKLGDVKASFTITLKSQFGPDYDVKNTCCDHFFSASGGNCHSGWHSFIDLVTLNDPDKGYIKDGCVQLKLELSLEEVDIDIPASTISTSSP